MKRFLTIALTALLLTVFTACGDSKKENTDPTTDSTTDSTTDPTTDPTTAPTTDPTTEPTTEPDLDADECAEITFDEIKVYYDDYMIAMVAENAADDTSLPDMLTVEFHDDNYSTLHELTAGIYEIGDYETCRTCIRLYADVDTNQGYLPAKTYYANKGIFNITEVKEGTLESKGNASFKLVEFDEDYHPIEGGTCYKVKNMTWDTICVPQCEGKVCGDDGCGGTCGKGCDLDTTCNAEQNECVPYDCTEIELDTDEGSINSKNNYETTFSPFIGEESLDDNFQIQFHTEDTVDGVYDLADTNYQDCEVCLLVFEDMKQNSNSHKKDYFQQKGSITFSTSGTNVTATLSGVRLEEVKIDRYKTYISTPVAGGSCFTVKDTTISYTIEEN